MDKYQHIIDAMPYGESFLFVDRFISISDDECIGQYTYQKNEYFYPHHFENYPITPGVILLETMAQIGLVGFGIYLHTHSAISPAASVFSSADVLFLKPVYPGETVTVTAKKMYYRLNKLKCQCTMLNAEGEVVCSGALSGVQITKDA